MERQRRRILKAVVGGMGVSLLPRLGITQSAPLGNVQIRLNLPGPGSLPFLPLELIPALGFDAEMGARLLLRYHASGIRAIEDMLIGNADFTSLGFPTLPVMQARGKDVVAVAPLAGSQHTFQLIIRKDLASKIKRIEDVKGRTIGVSTGSPNNKTYMQMLAEIMLAAHGIGSHQIHWLPSGQNWDSLSGALISKAADAVFCEQPFPTRLLRAGIGVSLADLNDPRIQARVAGVDALRSCIATSRMQITLPDGPNKADLMVRMLRRTLVWLQTTPPDKVAIHATVQNESDREDIITLLTRLSRIYSTDARFITKQIEATDVFLRAAQPDMKLPTARSLVDERWAGSKIS